jgi:hypothetical protein
MNKSKNCMSSTATLKKTASPPQLDVARIAPGKVFSIPIHITWMSVVRGYWEQGFRGMPMSILKDWWIRIRCAIALTRSDRAVVYAHNMTGDGKSDLARLPFVDKVTRITPWPMASEYYDANKHDRNNISSNFKGKISLQRMHNFTAATNRSTGFEYTRAS